MGDRGREGEKRERKTQRWKGEREGVREGDSIIVRVKRERVSDWGREGERWERKRDRGRKRERTLKRERERGRYLEG